ncbi:hypothetical protein GGX14DRAFT_573497 [Mycena pura]|uniref:Uncharacterized protein n=1 Tax=Mycena pura TaxID=153505 RepID=A0AAD6UZL8_9AGAR|nr:hypothetical protein GGX14DRAFT_573497 [Mycena pura]
MSQPAKALLILLPPESERKGFPAAWLEPIADKYVIDFPHWNKEPAPETDPSELNVSVEWGRFGGTNYLTPWKYGVEIAGLIMRLYYDIRGCIIPVAYIPNCCRDTYVFTLAGPCNDEGKKDFYLFTYDEPLEATVLCMFPHGFCSIADFHLSHSPGGKFVRVQPRPGGTEETEDAFLECGFYEVPGEPVKYEYEWSPDWRTRYSISEDFWRQAGLTSGESMTGYQTKRRPGCRACGAAFGVLASLSSVHDVRDRVRETAGQSVVHFLDTPASERKGFPVAWLEPIADKYVIDFAHWNKEPVPESDTVIGFSVEWSQLHTHLTSWQYGVEIAGLIIRLYYGIRGCIIPVACMPDFCQDTFVFTIAGPCNDEGKKDFYIFAYDEPLDATGLHKFQHGFSSIGDFHLNRSPDQLERVEPLPDGAAETEDAFFKCGYYKVPGESIKYECEWSPDWGTRYFNEV